MLTRTLPVSSRSVAESRIWFLQLLRAVAILLVVFYHLIIWNTEEHFFRSDRFGCFATFKQIYRGISSLHIEMDLVGVAIFFLISGFLIPISIKKYGSLGFLVARIFRIFPIYGLVLALIATITAIYFSDFHAPLHTAIYLPSFSALSLYTQDWRSYLWSLLLLPERLGKSFIEPVAWTLRVEVIFYVIAAFLNTFSSTRKFSTLFLTGTILCFLSRVPYNIDSNTNFLIFYLLTLMRGYASNVIFILIGTAFYNHFSQKEPARLSIQLVLQVFLLLSLCFIAGLKGALFISYGIGLIVFYASLSFRRILRKNSFLNWIGDISYPLYLSHNLFGIMLNFLLLGILNNSYLALFLSTLAIFGISYMLHICIEQPCNSFGKRLVLNLKDGMNHLVSAPKTSDPSIYTRSAEAKVSRQRPKVAYITAATSLIVMCTIFHYYIFPTMVHYPEHKALKLPCKLESRLRVNASAMQYCMLDRINNHAYIGNSAVVSASQEPEFFFNGWAVKPQDYSLSGGVFGIIDGKLALPFRYGLARPDVSNALRKPDSRDCGYTGSCSSKLFTPGEHTISLAVMDRDKEHYNVWPNAFHFNVQ